MCSVAGPGAQPVLTKSGADVVKALKALFHRAGSRRPHKIQTDRGLEFLEQTCQEATERRGCAQTILIT